MRPQSEVRAPVVLGLAGIDRRQIVQELSPLPEALGGEDASSYLLVAEGDAHVLAQPAGRRNVGCRRPPSGLRHHPPFRLMPDMQSAPPGDGLDQGRLARAVLADEEAHRSPSELRCCLPCSAPMSNGYPPCSGNSSPAISTARSHSPSSGRSRSSPASRDRRAPSFGHEVHRADVDLERDRQLLACVRSAPPACGRRCPRASRCLRPTRC